MMGNDAELYGWCVVGNISDHLRGGTDPEKYYQGTRMFSPSTKVYLGSTYWGMGGMNLHVIGLRRISRKLVNCVVQVGILENLRVKSIYSESLWSKLTRLEAECFSAEEEADHYREQIVAAWNWEGPKKLQPETITGPWGSFENDRYREN